MKGGHIWKAGQEGAPMAEILPVWLIIIFGCQSKRRRTQSYRSMWKINSLAQTGRRDKKQQHVGDPSSSSTHLHVWPFSLMWPSSAASPLPVSSLFKHPPLNSEPDFLSPLCFSFLFSLPACLTLSASFFDPPLLSQSLNTFNLLSSSLICHCIHPMLPFIISPYRPPPSVLLLLSACLKDGFKDPLSPFSPSTQ